MKIAKTIFAALFLVSNIAASSMAPADDGVIEKAVAPGSYCHQKFRTIDPSTLDSDNPSLRSSTSGDVIGYYGPCDETPTGKDQVWRQKLDRLFWRTDNSQFFR